MHPHAAGDAGAGMTASEQTMDGDLAPCELEAGASAASGATERAAFGASAGEGFAGALGNEVAFYLRGERERKRQHLAADVRAEAVVVLDCPDLHFAVEALVEDAHYHHEAAPEARQLRAHEHVALPQLREHGAELALVGFLGARNGFLYPTVYGDALALAEAVDFEALVFDGLFVGAHADVSINHRGKRVDVRRCRGNLAKKPL